MTEIATDVLPRDWSLKPLAELVERTSKSDPRRSPDRLLKYVDVSSVSAGSLRISDWKSHRGADAPSRARKQMRRGDVLFATVRPRLRRLAQVPADLDGEVCSTAFTVLRANPELLDSTFLFYAVADPRFVARVSRHERGSGYPAVRDGDVLREVIAVPPLPEQRAIAHALRTVQRAREATEQVAAAARELRRALAHHVFSYGPVPLQKATEVSQRRSEAGVIPSRWQALTIADIAEAGSDGVVAGPFGSNLGTKDYVEYGVPVIRGVNLVDNRFSTQDLTFVSEAKATELHRCLARPGDVVVTQRGTLGQAAVIPESTPFERLVVSQSQMRVRTDLGRMYPDFLYYALLTPDSQRRIEEAAIRSGVPHINLGTLRAFVVPVPSLHEQRIMVSLLATADRKIAAEGQRREVLDTLFKSLLHDLMTGKRRVAQDHVDEDAEASG